MPLREIDAALTSALATAFADHALTASPKDSWQQQVEVRRAPAPASEFDRMIKPNPAGEPLMLLARGSRLPLDDGLGYVVVFDDITQVISAQRALAWGEVARRLAHEIKNPLTPIQLAAERLQMKLIEKLSLPDVDVLKRGTSTIVSQVSAMKRMVDDFRDYARVPPARLSPLALNTLVEEVAALYGAEAGHGAIQLSLRPGLPLIEGDATQLRQVIHNLLVNSQDALAGPIQCAHSSTHRAGRNRGSEYQGARGAAGRRRQWTGISGEYTSPCVRALCHEQIRRYRPWPCDGEEESSTSMARASKSLIAAALGRVAARSLRSSFAGLPKSARRRRYTRLDVRVQIACGVSLRLACKLNS